MLVKPKAYIETTIVSYLTAWPARDIVVAGRQQITRDWWKHASDRFELVASELVLSEAGAGDSKAASDRLAALEPIALLETTGEALKLAEELIISGAIPEKAAEDAAHIAISVANGVEYLVTWNCRHIANATMRLQIETVCRAAGFEPPVICTPEELTEPNYGEE